MKCSTILLILPFYRLFCIVISLGLLQFKAICVVSSLYDSIQSQILDNRRLLQWFYGVCLGFAVCILGVLASKIMWSSVRKIISQTHEIDYILSHFITSKVALNRKITAKQILEFFNTCSEKHSWKMTFDPYDSRWKCMFGLMHVTSGNDLKHL